MPGEGGGGAAVWSLSLCLVGVWHPAEAHLHAQWDGTTGNWTDVAHWSTNPVYPDNGHPNAGDTYAVKISGGTVTRTTPVTISNLIMSGGGGIAGTSALTVTGATIWSGGLVRDGNLNCNGGLSITGAARFYGAAAVLTLAGGQTASMTGFGALSLEYQTKVTNNGTFYASNDSGISEADAFQSNFTNNGTFTRNTTTGTFTFSASQFDNLGTLNVDTGTLEFTHGIENSGAIQIAGGATLKMNGCFHWDGGTVSGAGALNANGGLDITHSVQLTDASINLASGQTAEQSGAGHLVLNGTATVTNAGTYFARNDDSVSPGTGAGYAFNNSGTLVRDTTDGVFTIAVPFHNTGTIRSTSGSLAINNGGSSGTATGDLDTDGGDIYLNGGTYEFNGGALTGSGFVYASAGLVLVTGDTGATSGPATGGFGISAGTVGGSAMLSADHGYFSNGTMTGTAVLRFTGNSSKASNSMLTMTGGTIRNDGTFTQGYQANYDLDADSCGGAGTLANHGSWTLTNSSAFYNTYGGGVIDNSGSFNQAGGGISVNAAFNNRPGGTLNSTAGYILLQGGGSQDAGCTFNANGGSIYFNGGSHVLNGGTLTGSDYSYVSAGSVTVAGDVGAASGPATGGFGVAGGLLGGTATVSADHGYFSSGTIAGSVVVRLTGASYKSDNTALQMTGGTIRNEGSFTQNYQANYDLDADNGGGAGTIVNNGSWTLVNNCAFYNSYGGGIIDNAGAFNQAGGANSVNAAFHNQSGGTLNATAGYILLQGGGTEAAGCTLNANGGSIYFNGGLHTLIGGTFTGADYTYVSAGTVTVAADVGATSGPATGGFGIAGGLLAGAAMVAADHGYLGNGGITGGVIMRFTGTSYKSDNTMLYMAGGTIRNDGVFSQNYQANYDLDADNGGDAGTLINQGVWNLTNGSQFSNTYGGGMIGNSGDFNQLAGNNMINAAFANSPGGTLTASGGIIHLLGGGSLAAGATLNANGGSIYFQGGTHEFNGGTLTGGSYSYVVGGLVNINHNIGATSGAASGGFGIAGGTVGGTAMISADHGYLGDGAMTGSAVLRFTGASDKGNYTTLYMGGGTIRNDGTFTQNYQANIETDSDPADGGGTIRNNGTWNLTNNNYITNSQGGGVLENNGDFNQLAGLNFIQAHVTNSGTIASHGGTVYLQGGSMHTGSLVTNSEIVLGSGSHVMTGAAARLGGSGSLYGNLTLADGATIAPGYPVGNLTIHGQVACVGGGSNPAYAVELAGPGTYDQLSIASGASLDLGSNLTDLRISLLYAPEFGAVYRIISGDSSGLYAGTFRNAPATGSIVTASYNGHPYSMQIAYSGGGRFVDLTVLSPYQTWTYGKGLSGDDAAFDADPDHDGISNGIEFVIGGEPNPANPGSDSHDLLPQCIVDGNYLRVTYRRNVDAAYLTPAIQYNADLADTWTVAQQGTHGVILNVFANDYGPNLDRVEVLIPRSNEVAGKLFARLSASEP